MVLVYLYWWHQSFLYNNKPNLVEETAFLKNHRPTYEKDKEERKDIINLKQIDNDEKRTNNRIGDHRDEEEDDLKKDLERHHLFSESNSRSRKREKNDRSSSKLDFNTQYQKILTEQIINVKASSDGSSKVNRISENIKFNNKEIQNEKIQNNTDHSERRVKSSILFTPTTITSQLQQPLLLPAHLSKAINPQFEKNYSFLSKLTTKTDQPPQLVSKTNQSSSLVSPSYISSIFPDEKRKKSRSMLEKQLAWYELVGITMFNLFGSSFGEQKNHTKFLNENKKFQNHSTISNRTSTLIRIPRNQTKKETTLSKSTQIQNNKIINTKSNQTLSIIKNLERRLPGCIIIGVRKSGTRAVLEYLSLNDHIRKADNEVHFFDNDERYAMGLEFYRNQMPYSAVGQITIEKSPAYFVTSTVPERIKAMNASIKLILIVRDPVIRLISDYTQLAHNKLLKLDDLMHTSGMLSSNKQHQSQQNQYSNSKFPIGRQQQQQQKQKKSNNLEKQPIQSIQSIYKPTTSSKTNEQLAFLVNEEKQENNFEKKKRIEKNLFADYWNRIDSETDYRKNTEQLDDNEENDEEEEDDNFVSLPIVKRQINKQQVRNEMNVIDNRLMKTIDEKKIQVEKKRQKKKQAKEILRERKSIDFKDSFKNSKIIDQFRLDRRKTKKLKTNRNRTREEENKLKAKKSINSTKIKINFKKSKDIKSKIKRTRTNRQTDQNFLDENSENYWMFKDLNVKNDDDFELDDDYSKRDKNQIKNKKSNHHQQTKQENLKEQTTVSSTILSTNIVQVMTNHDDNKNDDYHNWKIPKKFEDLVIHNGDVNTNYKPVKTSIYSLYMDKWLRVSSN